MWDGIERRKRMSSDFQPQTAFEGYVVAKLESMTDRLNALPCREDSKRVTDLEKKIANIEGKSSIIGAAFGFIAGIISKYIFGK